MKAAGLGKEKTINAFVGSKIKKLGQVDKNMKNMFSFMFSESENVMFEQSDGIKISKKTYGECKKLSVRRAAALSALLVGHEKNAVVGLYMDNGSEWIECFWAILMCSCRPLLLNMRLPDEVIEKTLAEIGAIAVLSDKKTFSIKTINPFALVLPENACEPDEFGDEFFVMSSGTSQNVKICGYKAENLYAQIVDSCGIIKKCALIKKHYEGRLKQLTMLPFYHIFGFVAVYMWFAFFSRTFVLLRDMSPETIIRTVRRHKVTHIFAVPLFWEKVYSQAIAGIKARGDKTYKKFLKGMKISCRLGNSAAGKLFRKYAFSEVRDRIFGDTISFCITGGGAISPEAIEFFNAIGYRLADGYGATEIGITSVELSNKFGKITSRSVGKPFSSCRYLINEKGELMVSGASSASEIYEGGVLREKTEWFDTHDLAEYKNGRYYISGRVDDLIISPNGENLNPLPAESSISADGVKRVCLIPGENGNLPVLLASVGAFITPARAKSVLSQLNRKLVSLNLKSQIGKIELIGEEFISGEEFKLNRKRIASDYHSGKLKIVSSGDKPEQGEWDELTLKIRSLFSAALNINADDLSLGGDFFTDYNGTSIDYFAFSAAFAREFSLPTETVISANLHTIEAAAAFVRANQ